MSIFTCSSFISDEIEIRESILICEKLRRGRKEKKDYNPLHAYLEIITFLKS